MFVNILYNYMSRLLYNMEFLLFLPVFLVTVIQAQTDPTNIVCTAVNSTALSLTWTAAIDTSVIGYFLDVERVDGLRVEPAIPTKDLNDRSFDTHDTSGLGKYGTYDITLFSYTASANLTQHVTTCTTSEDVPDSSAQNFSCESYTESAIRCTWSALEQVYWNGIQQGYRLQYMKTESVSQLYSTTVDNSTTTTVLSGLQYGTMYTLLLNAYTSVGDGIAYVTTNAPTQGYNNGPVEENVTRYFCNEAVPGMIEFGWEEMPCTIYSGTIGALIIVCTLFISIFACQACCQRKGGGTNEISVNLFQDNAISRGRKFNDDDSETDDGDEDEKRNLDDEYNDSASEDEEYDNEGYSPDHNHKYDRYTATPDDERNTEIPEDERHTVTPGDDRNTTTPGGGSATPDGDRNTTTHADGAQSSMSTTKDQQNAPSSNRATRNHLPRKQVMSARKVELNNLNEEENEHSDNVFSDSDYDSQSDNDFVEEDNVLNNEGISLKPHPVVISKLTAVNNKKPNTNKQVKKSSEIKSNQVLKGKDVSRNELAMGKKSKTTKTTVDVHTPNSDINENEQIHTKPKTQTNKTGRLKSGLETAVLASHSAKLSRGPSANVQINDDTFGEIDEWGSPTFVAVVNQTNKTSTISEDKLIIQEKRQENIGASNNDLHDKGKSWEEGDDWGDSFNNTNESQKATAPKRFNNGLSKQKNTALNTTWDEGDDWGDSSNITNLPIAPKKLIFGVNNQQNEGPSRTTWGRGDERGNSKLDTNKKALNHERKEQHKYDKSNSEWDEDAGLGDPNPRSSQSQLSTSTRMLQTHTKGQTHTNVKKTDPAQVSMSNETHYSDNNIPTGWNSPLSTQRSDNAVNSNKENMVRTSDANDCDAKSTNTTKSLQHTHSHAFGNQRNKPAAAYNDSKPNVNKTFGKQPSKTSNMHVLHEPVNDKSMHGSSNFISEELADNSGQANTERPVQQKVHTQSKRQTSVAPTEAPSQRNNESGRNNGNGQSLQNVEGNRRNDTNHRQPKNGKISSRGQQKPNTSTMEYKNMFYMEDEIENVQSSVETKDLQEQQRPKSEQNGRMIPTKAWQPQTQNLSKKSGRKTPVKSIPKAQSWTTMEPEPVIETDRLGKKFPFLNVDPSSRATTPKMKRNASETDVHKFDSAMPELRRTSEPVKSDKMKDAVNVFTETTKKSKKGSLSYGFGVHDRFREVAAAWLAKFRGKKNPVKTVNSEWF